jgi:hypothetical protein
MLRNKLSRVVLVCGAVAVAVLMAGCQGDTDDAKSPEVPTISGANGAPPASTITPPTSSAKPPQAQPPVDGTPRPGGEKPAPVTNPAECKVADLRLSLSRGEGAAGTFYRDLRFTNKGGRTCVIQGFPGVSYVAGADGHQVGPSAYRDGTKGPAISLKPGMTVYAPVGFVQVGNYDPAQCRPTSVRGIRVYPPHEYDSMFVPAPGTGCAATPPGNQLTVQTIRR